jgi:transposase
MTITKQQVHVITSVERRRRWSTAEKRSIVQETYLPGMSVSLIARKYDINPCQLFAWRKLMEDGGLKGIQSKEEVVPKSQVKELEAQIRELERILGRKTLENEILKDAIKLAREKKLISRQPLPGEENMGLEQ